MQTGGTHYSSLLQTDGVKLDQFLVGAGSEERPNWEEWLKRMRKCGEWGDQITLQAAADSYQVNIELLNDEGYLIELRPQARPDENLPTITLGHVGEYHYVSLIPGMLRKYSASLRM